MGLSEHYAEFNGDQQDNGVVFHDAQISHGYLFLCGKSEKSGSSIIMISQSPESVQDKSTLRDMISAPASLDEILASTCTSITLAAPCDGSKIIEHMQAKLADGRQIDYSARYAAVQHYMPNAFEQDIHDYAIDISKTSVFLTEKNIENNVGRYQGRDETHTSIDPNFKHMLF